jgi:hypothetical protein
MLIFIQTCTTPVPGISPTLVVTSYISLNSPLFWITTTRSLHLVKRLISRWGLMAQRSRRFTLSSTLLLLVVACFCMLLLVVALCHSLLLIMTHCHSLVVTSCCSLLLFVTRCCSLSLVVTRSLSLVVARCHLFSFIVIRCHSLSLARCR